MLGKCRSNRTAAILNSAPDTAPIQKGANLGLQILYQPPDPSSAVVDIVFIHGLTGNAYSTWYHKECRVHWPSELLEADIPDARIFAFGYDASVVSFWGHSSRNRLGDHAHDLMGDLVREREATDTENRKVIFVAHSLGGLVVDKTLCLSRGRAEAHLRHIEACTVGVVYLGTPHNGSDLAAWAVLCTKLVAKFKDANVDILRTLERESEVLRDTQDAYGQLLESRKMEGSKINVTCFFEELAVTGVGQIVPPSSATLLGYSYYGLPANHMNMTKFAAPTEPGYKRVVGEIKRWVKPLRHTAEQQVLSQEILPVLSPLEEECLRTLHFDEMSARRDAIDPVHEKTFGWVWSDVGFLNWLHSSQSIYWISGKPGSGKSMMMKHLYEGRTRIANALSHSDQYPPPARCSTPVIVNYFFDFKAGKLARSIEGLLRSLLYQLLSQNRSFFNIILPLFQQIQGRRSVAAWSRHDLESSFRSILQSSPPLPVLFFIDALDEYDGQDSTIAAFLDPLTKLVPGTVKFCLASRPYPDFAFQFINFAGFSVDKHSSYDIRIYVQDRFEEARAVLGAGYEALVDATLEKAEGVFLWVRLVSDELQRGWRRFESAERLRERLNDMPKDLLTLYERILAEMEYDDREYVCRMLATVASAGRPLSLLELHYAMANCIAPGNLRDQAKDKLLPFDSGVVPRRDPREYGQQTFDQSEETYETIAQQHARLSGAIERRINAAFQQTDAVPLQLVFLRYSTDFLLFHAKNAELETGEGNNAIINQLSGDSYMLWRRLYHIHNPRVGRKIPLEKLALAIETQLEKYCEAELQTTPAYGNEGVNRDSGRLLFAVAKSGSARIAEILIARGASLKPGPEFQKSPQRLSTNLTAQESKYKFGTVRHYGQAALARAIHFNNANIVDLLIRNGAKMVTMMRAPLSYAWLDSGGIVRMRVMYGDAGLPMNSLSKSLRRSNATSVKYARVEAPESSARPSLGNWEFWALGHAIESRARDAFDILLNYYRTADAQPALNRALCLAASSDMEDFVKALLGRGANANVYLDSWYL